VTGGWWNRPRGDKVGKEPPGGQRHGRGPEDPPGWQREGRPDKPPSKSYPFRCPFCDEYTFNHTRRSSTSDRSMYSCPRAGAHKISFKGNHTRSHTHTLCTCMHTHTHTPRAHTHTHTCTCTCTHTHTRTRTNNPQIGRCQKIQIDRHQKKQIDRHPKIRIGRHQKSESTDTKTNFARHTHAHKRTLTRPRMPTESPRTSDEGHGDFCGHGATTFTLRGGPSD
jgi:hypothetical protein